jgi:glutamate dehydrogenase (NADP+)
MAKSVQSRLDKFMNGLKRRNPGEHEFHQAVYEVAVDIISFSSRFNPEHSEIFSLRTDV